MSSIKLAYDNISMSDVWLMEYIESKPDVPLHIIITLIIIGTIGNILVCLAIYFDKKLQNLTNYFLLSLAVTDLLINVIILPARLLSHVFITKPSHVPWCYAYMFGHDYLHATSTSHICVISAERYFAIKDPLNALNISKCRIYKKISFVWLISLLFIIPYIIDLSALPKYPSHCPHLLTFIELFKAVLYTECLTIFLMMAIVLYYFILTTTLLYKLARKRSVKGPKNDAEMIRTIGRNKSENSSRVGKPPVRELNTEIKAFGVVWLVSLAFIIAMGPYAILNMVFVNKPNIEIPPALFKMAAYLTYFNSVINPILYTIFNKRYRDDFKNIILCKIKRI